MSQRLNLVLGLRMDVAFAHHRRTKGAKKLASTAPMAKLNLIVLSDCHGDNGRIFPGYETIMRGMGCTSRHTVSHAIHANEALGFLQITRRHRDVGARLIERTNWYVINWARIRQFQGEDSSSAPGARDESGSSCAQRTSASAPRARVHVRRAHTNRSEQPRRATAAANSHAVDAAAADALRSELKSRRIPSKNNAHGDLAVAGAGILTAAHVKQALDEASNQPGVKHAQAVAALKLWDMLDAARERAAKAAARTASTTAQHAAPISLPTAAQQAAADDADRAAMLALPDAELAGIKANALANAGEFAQRRYRTANPRTNRALQTLMLHAYTQREARAA